MLLVKAAYLWRIVHFLIKCTATAHLPQQETISMIVCVTTNNQAPIIAYLALRYMCVTQTHLISLLLYKDIRDITEVDLLLLNKVLDLICFRPSFQPPVPIVGLEVILTWP